MQNCAGQDTEQKEGKGKWRWRKRRRKTEDKGKLGSKQIALQTLVCV
jgi:hypothetical protein